MVYGFLILLFFMYSLLFGMLCRINGVMVLGECRESKIVE